jgi:hypothetical protein
MRGDNYREIAFSSDEWLRILSLHGPRLVPPG